jgi:hypothetical protein
VRSSCSLSRQCRHTARAATTEERSGPHPWWARTRSRTPGEPRRRLPWRDVLDCSCSPFPSPSEYKNSLPRTPSTLLHLGSFLQGPTHLQPLAGAPPPPTTSISLAAGAQSRPQSSLREDEDACWLLLTGVAMGYERIHKVQVTDELSSAASSPFVPWLPSFCLPLLAQSQITMILMVMQLESVGNALFWVIAQYFSLSR